MSKDLNTVQPPTIAVAEIVHHGEKLTLPESMSIDSAIDLLQRRKKYLSEETQVVEAFEAFPYDGAAALERVLVKRYGWAPAVPTPGFWGDKPPQLVSIEVAYGVTKQVPWGRFRLPNIEGNINTVIAPKNGRAVFGLVANVLRRDENAVKALFADIREELLHNSIYRGQAIRISFVDDDGDNREIPEVKFIDTDVDDTQLIFSKPVQDAIETNMFTPLRRMKDCELSGIPFKRGVLLGGPFGTGKTLGAKVASKLATQAGITFIYIQRADELPQAVEFSKLYPEPACAIFCEDIDRTMDGERDEDMDLILNTIDGIDSKSSKVMVIVTTNALEKINPAMLRPGRLDAVIEVTPPDADAVQRLLRAYGKGMIDNDEDLTEAGEELAGQVPAVVAEVVKRAKLAQLRRLPEGQAVKRLTGEALAEAARTMARQVSLLQPRTEVKEPSFKELVAEGVKHAHSLQ